MENIVINQEHITGVDTNVDSSGIAGEFTVQVYDISNGLIATGVTVGSFIEMGSTGSYRVGITFSIVGKYSINIVHSTGTLTKMVSVTNADADIILTKLTAMQDFLCACATDSSANTDAQLATIDSGLRQILGNLGDEININEVKIENATKTMSMII